MMVASVGLRMCGLWPVLPGPAGVKPRRSVWSLLCPFRRSPRFAVRRRTLLGPLPRPFACHDRAHIRPSRRPHRPLHVPSPSWLLLLSPRRFRVAPDRSLARRPRLGPAGGLGVFTALHGRAVNPSLVFSTNSGACCLLSFSCRASRAPSLFSALLSRAARARCIFSGVPLVLCNNFCIRTMRIA